MASATELQPEASPHDVERGAVAAYLGLTVAGTYRIVRPIGHGGSSHVFEAEHVRLGKLFALKLLRAELDPQRRTAQRFRREARAIARIHNEHVVSVVDCGELEGGTPYLVTELLAGEDLRSLLHRSGALPARRCVALLVDACRGLAAVHAAGLVHRDLKPENLFVTRRATGEDWCKVLDFGVAKLEHGTTTAEGALVGTLSYMAPEQLADGSAVSPATDIYALGAILYECLRGQPMHEAATTQELMFKVLNKAPRHLSLDLPTLPAPLSAIVMRCLAKLPQARPSSAVVLERALLESLSAGTCPTNVRTVSEDASPADLPQRNKSRVGAILPVVAIFLGVVLLWRLFARSPPTADAESARPVTKRAAPARPPMPSSSTSQPEGPPGGRPPQLLGTSSATASAASAPPRVPRSMTLSSTRVRPQSEAHNSKRVGSAAGIFDPANPYGE